MIVCVLTWSLLGVKKTWATPGLACVAWRFWLGALSNKGGRGQRNREEIGAVFILLAASPLVGPARQNHHATQATPGLVSYRGLMQNFRQASQPLSYAESPPGLFPLSLTLCKGKAKLNVIQPDVFYFLWTRPSRSAHFGARKEI